MLSAGDAATTGVPKNNPLTTALAPPVSVTFNLMCPCRFHTRYCPFWNPDTVRVSSTALVPASNTSIRSARTPPESQSRQYNATWCTFPSVRLISMLMLENVYHPDAIRSVAEDFWSQRTSAADPANTNGPSPL